MNEQVCDLTFFLPSPHSSEEQGTLAAYWASCCIMLQLVCQLHTFPEQGGLAVVVVLCQCVAYISAGTLSRSVPENDIETEIDN